MTLRSSISFVVVNAGGIEFFLCSASRFWIEPELADMPGVNVGNAFGWIILAAPIPILFIIGNLFWTIKQIRRTATADWFRYAAMNVTALACWFSAYLFDNAHHGA